MTQPPPRDHSTPDHVGRDHLSRAETRKDALQDTVEATATAVGAVTTIVTTAVRDIARTVGGLATDVFDIRESVRRARADVDPAGPDRAGRPTDRPDDGEIA